MTVGDLIKKARKSAKMTQQELAQKLNISFTLISQYERGIRNPKIDTLRRIADALGVNIGQLIPRSMIVDEDGVQYSGQYSTEDDPDSIFKRSNSATNKKSSSILNEEKEKALLIGIQIGKLLASGKPLYANLLNSIGVENDAAAILAQYFQLDKNSRDQIFKALEKSLNHGGQEDNEK